MLFAYGSAGGGVHSNSNQSIGLFTYQVGPGLDFFVNEHVAFEARLTYNGNKLNSSNASYINGVLLNIGLQVFF